MKSKLNSNILLCVPCIASSLLLSIVSIINIAILQNKNWSARGYVLGLIILVLICSFMQLLFVGIYMLSRKRIIKASIAMESISFLASILIIIDYIIYNNWFQHMGSFPTNECPIMPTSIILNAIVLIGFIAEVICFITVLFKNKNNNKNSSKEIL